MIHEDLRERFRSIGISGDYSALDLNGLAVDLQGWGDAHPIFDELITRLEPVLVIEVGSWKGASLVRMANRAVELGLPTQFIAIDTWLGSHRDLWLEDAYRTSLMLRGGYPTMFRQFACNLLASGISDRVFPMPMTTTAAAMILEHWQITADMIYIYAAHDEFEVSNDLRAYYRLLKPGGTIFGDDYSENWPGVVKAVNTFAADAQLRLRSQNEKWWIEKPV